MPQFLNGGSASGAFGSLGPQMQSFQHVGSQRSLNLNYGGGAYSSGNSYQNVSQPNGASSLPLNSANPAVNGTDVHLNSLKICFKQAANSLTQLYKQSTFSYNVAY